MHKQLYIEQEKNREWTQPITCHLLNSKTKEKYNDKSWLKHCGRDNKTNVRAYFYNRYRKKKRQQRRQTYEIVTFANQNSTIGKLILCLKVIAGILALDCYAV